MSGLGEILEENARLRELVRERDGQLAVQAEQFTALLAVQAEQFTAQAKQFTAVLEAQAKQIEALTASNERFAQHFEFLEKRRQMAAAERMASAELQSPLFDGLQVAAPPRDPELEKKAEDDKPDGRKTAKHNRKGRRDVSALPFPRTKVEAPVNPSTCEQCGAERVIVEPRISHRVGWVPGHFAVVEIHQQQCRCPHCPKAETWTAPEPSLIPGAMCDDSLLARTLVDRSGDHLPYNRQADRMTRQGFPINENVLSGWARQGAQQVRLLVGALRSEVAAAQTLLGDDSGFPKEGEHPTAILHELGVEGVRLVVDGGSEYNDAVASLGLSRGGCWAHLRRYFFNAAVQHDDAKHGLRTINDLFLIERQVADLSDADRLAVRTERSAPLVDGFYTWVKALVPKVRPGSKLGDAVGYGISQEPRMRLFLAHGDVPLHNNLSELLLRQPIVGRKNWLFNGSEGGARAAADWFSLIASCRMQKVDPWTYLYDVFGRLPDHSSKRVHELTPMNWRLAVEKGDIVPRSLAPES
jgi:transposase